MNLKENVINQVVQAMSIDLNSESLNKLLYTMSRIFKDLDIIATNAETLPMTQYEGNRLIDSFIASKKLKGCTETTLR